MTHPKMHPDEADTDVALVERLISTQFPHWSGLAVEAVPHRGTDNALYRLGDDMVVRLPNRSRPELALKKECRWLPELAPLLPLAVPTPVALGAPGEGFPFEWAVYCWLEGALAIETPIADHTQAATDLAGFLRALQAIPAEGPSPDRHNVGRGEPLRERDDETREAIARLGDAIDGEAATAAWDAAVRTREWAGPPLWIHGDLDARNLLVREGRVVAVIDFGCLGVGDPACDVMVAWKLFTSETRGSFRDALSVDDDTWARGCGWALSQAVGALSYYTLETNPTLVVEATSWLAEVLADGTLEP